MVQNAQKCSDMVLYCPKRFKMVKKLKRLQNVQTGLKWFNNGPKFPLKMSAVGAKAVGVTAVRNDLKF